MASIIVVEDQAHIRRILTMWMSRHGHEVHTASKGLDALEHLRTHAVDLMITDVNMPGMNGIELTRLAFDACPTLRSVFIVTSRCDQNAIRAELPDPRVSVHLKPFSPSQLWLDVEKALGAPSAKPDRPKETTPPVDAAGENA